VTLVSLVSGDQSRNIPHDALSKAEKSIGKYRSNVSILLVSVLSRKCGLFSVKFYRRRGTADSFLRMPSVARTPACISEIVAFIIRACLLSTCNQLAQTQMQLKKSRRGSSDGCDLALKAEQVD